MFETKGEILEPQDSAILFYAPKELHIKAQGRFEAHPIGINLREVGF
jgi:hypothetical protein